jgi:hypothetical protein
MWSGIGQFWSGCGCENVFPESPVAPRETVYQVRARFSLRTLNY